MTPVASRLSRPRLVLASASPRRLALLRQIGIEPDEVVAADVDEDPKSRERAVDLARRLACAKAGHVSADGGNAYVLAADTVVACGRRLLPKAEDRATAARCLALLSGRRHRVVTGLCVNTPGGRKRLRTVTTVVSFKRLSHDELDWYLDSGDWRGKAGGYAIQGLAAPFVSHLSGSYSNVVGLPLHETAMLLNGLGYPVFGLRGPET